MPDSFDEVTFAFTNSSLFRGAVEESREQLHREQPGRAIDVLTIGHQAWRQLTPVEQAHALDDLLVAYICRLGDEKRYHQLSTAAADETKTYIEPDDEHILADSLSSVERLEESTVVDGVCATALHNVLSELDLLRHRLRMATADSS